MLGSLVPYSLETCFTTNWESLLAERVDAWRLVASRSPAMIVSYSASLLVALKLNRSACLILNPFGLVNIIPAPLFF